MNPSDKRSRIADMRAATASLARSRQQIEQTVALSSNSFSELQEDGEYIEDTLEEHKYGLKAELNKAKMSLKKLKESARWEKLYLRAARLFFSAVVIWIIARRTRILAILLVFIGVGRNITDKASSAFYQEEMAQNQLEGQQVPREPPIVDGLDQRGISLDGDGLFLGEKKTEDHPDISGGVVELMAQDKVLGEEQWVSPESFHDFHDGKHPALAEQQQLIQQTQTPEEEHPATFVSSVRSSGREGGEVNVLDSSEGPSASEVAPAPAHARIVADIDFGTRDNVVYEGAHLSRHSSEL